MAAHQQHREGERLIAALPLEGDRSVRLGQRWPIIAASVLVHLLVLASLGLTTPRPIYTAGGAEHPIALRLITLPRLKVHVARNQPQRESSRASLTAALPSPLRPHIAPPPVAGPASPVSAPPGPPSLAGQAEPPSGVTSFAPAPLPQAEGGRGVRAMLRETVGCDYDAIVHLTAEEKARCAARFAKQAREAKPFVGIPGEKLGGYMAEAAANERKQRYREGNMPTPVVACTGNGSNFGLGCLPADAIHTTRH